MKITCTKKQKELLIEIIQDARTCQLCPILKKCSDKYRNCDDVLESEIEWEIK